MLIMTKFQWTQIRILHPKGELHGHLITVFRRLKSNFLKTVTLTFKKTTTNISGQEKNRFKDEYASQEGCSFLGGSKEMREWLNEYHSSF